MSITSSQLLRRVVLLSLLSLEHKFYTRISNQTSVVFDKEELDVLNKGLKYNIPPNLRNNNRFINEIANMEAAIKTVSDHQIQNELRALMNVKLNKRIKLNKPLTTYRKHATETKILGQIKDKLTSNNAVITKADKGNTIVILDTQVYNNKVLEFIDNNNIRTLNSDPTNEYVKQLNGIINRCGSLFDDNVRRYIKPINARAPQLTGLPKIHKANIPVRPLINYTSAPGYKTAKKLYHIIKNSIVLKNNHSIKNNIDSYYKI